MTKTPKNKHSKPTTVLFIRHGENEWTQSHRLAGRMPNIHLNDTGREQARALGQRLAGTRLDAIYASPLERTLETAQAIANHHKVEVQPAPEFLEADYGRWTGKKIVKLAQKKSWRIIQHYPTGASFPDGETMFEMQARFVAAINRLVKEHPEQTIAIVGHADLIKAAVAHYLGVHFDLFQRLTISTASITTVLFSALGPRVVCVNDTHHNPPAPPATAAEQPKQEKDNA